MLSSDGLFISVDGPSGVGKTTTVYAQARLLRNEGRPVHITAEPSEGRIGTLARELTEEIRGISLACLYAADRYDHLTNEVLPRVDMGEIVITDRYIASALVMQQLDGVDPDYLWRINARAPKPHLAVILNAAPAVVAQRLQARGPHNRLQKLPSSAHLEWHHYQHAYQRVTAAGWAVQRIDCSDTTVAEVAHLIRGRLRQLEPGTTPGWS